MLSDLSIDYAERRVTLAGRAVHLTATEYGLLAELSANAGHPHPVSGREPIAKPDSFGGWILLRGASESSHPLLQ